MLCFRGNTLIAPKFTSLYLSNQLTGMQLQPPSIHIVPGGRAFKLVSNYDHKDVETYYTTDGATPVRFASKKWTLGDEVQPITEHMYEICARSFFRTAVPSLITTKRLKEHVDVAQV
eukprot:m.16975 g.16975  ORF g.16975 m.16975 type:complete len:117 (-) comp11115_c0_seq3:1123-1473(-)